MSKLDIIAQSRSWNRLDKNHMFFTERMFNVEEHEYLYFLRKCFSNDPWIMYFIKAKGEKYYQIYGSELVIKCVDSFNLGKAIGWYLGYGKCIKQTDKTLKRLGKAHGKNKLGR